jgi:hypothetical protein
MAKLDFNAALDVKAEDVKPVPLAPVGHYVFAVTKVPQIVTDQRWNRVSFPVRATSVFEDANDVDADDLAAYGKVTNIMNQVSFMFDSEEGTETDLIQFQNRVKNFVVNTLKAGDMSMSLRQLLNEAVNKKFVGQITHAPDKRDASGETMQANIGRTAPLE